METENEELRLVIIANLFIYLFIVQEVGTDSKLRKMYRKGDGKKIRLHWHPVFLSGNHPVLC